MPFGQRRCSTSTWAFNWSRVACNASAVRRHGSSTPSDWNSHAVRNWSSTADFCALAECTSRQNGPRPAFSNRRRTTSKAVTFCETNNTVFPAESKCAIRFEIVWLLPVPGGPYSTKLRPSVAATIAAVCEESACRGNFRSATPMRWSRPTASGSGESSAKPDPRISTSRRTTGFSSRSAA